MLIVMCVVTVVAQPAHSNDGLISETMCLQCQVLRRPLHPLIIDSERSPEHSSPGGTFIALAMPWAGQVPCALALRNITDLG